MVGKQFPWKKENDQNSGKTVTEETEERLEQWENSYRGNRKKREWRGNSYRGNRRKRRMEGERFAENNQEKQEKQSYKEKTGERR